MTENDTSVVIIDTTPQGGRGGFVYSLRIFWGEWFPLFSCKRERFVYLIQAKPEWLHELTKGYRGKSSPSWWAYPTNWIWKPPYCDLSLVQRGALVTLISMFCRDRDAFNQGCFETHRKELRLHGLTDRVLRGISDNFEQIQISVISESGEIKNL